MDHTMTQMNARLGSGLKAAGDEGLSRANISPSRAVRALWTFFERHKNEPKAITELVETLESQADGSEADRKARILRESQSLMKKISTLAGETPDSDTAPDDRKLMEEALVARYQERGLL